MLPCRFITGIIKIRLMLINGATCGLFSFQLDALDSDDFVYDVILEKLRDVLKYLKVGA